jgi:hypothetical protein
MATIEELQVQIKDMKTLLTSLEKDLERLKKIKGPKKIKTGLTELCFDREDIDGKYRKDLENYNKELENISRSSHYKITGGNLGNINLNIRDEQISKNILTQIKSNKDFNIEVFDCKKQKRLEKALNEKYKNVPLPGTGGTAPEFINYAPYIITIFLGKWVLGHLIKDADDFVWNKVKEISKKIFIPVKNNTHNDKKVALAINKNRLIIFLFDKNLSLEQFESAFIKIKKAIWAINQKTLKDKPYLPLIFDFNIKTKRWEKVVE